MFSDINQIEFKGRMKTLSTLRLHSATPSFKHIIFLNSLIYFLPSFTARSTGILLFLLLIWLWDIMCISQVVPDTLEVLWQKLSSCYALISPIS